MVDYVFGAMLPSGGPNNQGILGANGTIETGNIQVINSIWSSNVISTTVSAGNVNTGNIAASNVFVSNVTIGNVIIFPDGSQLYSAVGAVAVYDYTGNGSQTTYSTGNYAATSTLNTSVYIGGVYQRKNQYNWTGTNIIFNTAPPAATNIEIVVNTLNAPIATPNNGSVYPISLSTGGPSWDTTGNLTVSGNVSARLFNLSTATTAPPVGLFSPSANQLAFATNSTQQMTLTAAGNLLVGINTVSNNFLTTVYLSNLSTTGNSQALLQNWYAYDGNGSTLELTDTRIPAGGNYWPTAGMRLQQKIDATWMGYIQFNNGSGNVTNNAGISFGTGASAASPNSVPEVMRITSGGNVGINTTSAVTKLTVANNSIGTFTGNTLGTLALVDPTTTLNNYTSLDFATSGQGYPTARIASQYTSGGTVLTFGTSNNYATGITNAGMVMDPNGFIGIGTVTPSNYGAAVSYTSSGAIHFNAVSPATLQYSGAYIALTTPGASTNYSQTFLNQSFNTGPSDLTDTSFSIQQRTAGGSFVNTVYNFSYKNQSHNWYTNGTQKMFMDQYGNLSIGTTTINYALGNRTSFTVNGSSQAIMNISTGGVARSYWYTDSSNTYLLTESTGGALTIGTIGSNTIVFTVGNTGRAFIDVNGMLNPYATGTYDLGTTSYRWRNIYTSDLHLSNNIGDYTIVEGEQDLYIVNNKTKKSFKFALIPVPDDEVPPRMPTGS